MKETSTLFTVRLLAEQKAPTMQEGYIRLWKHRGEIQNLKEIAFDHLDELPKNIRTLLKQGKIKWPDQSSK